MSVIASIVAALFLVVAMIMTRIIIKARLKGMWWGPGTFAVFALIVTGIAIWAPL